MTVATAALAPAYNPGSWGTFFTLTGTAAATLTGLFFLAFSLRVAELQSYLNEFCFRFNRRRSRSRGLVFYRVLELAVGHDPVRYRDLVADPKAKAKPPAAPAQRGHPPSIERPRLARPWRTADLA
jgi:hypothetical protein